ncbi:MAG: TPM domain-containing protein [Candidatus Limnocylindria bacterium]
MCHLARSVRSSIALAALALLVLAPAGAPAAGPPFPDPVDGQAVYDTAGILSDAAIADAEATIDAIEARTAAEIVVYTQLVDYGVTTEETERRAIALIDQWGVGRAGFDDGMAIFFDIDPSLEHGQVQLYAAPGFETTFLTNSERQAIFDDDMLPYLRDADFDGALGVALERIDAAATPENAERLQAARQINAVLGLVGAPIVFLGLAGWAFLSWRRYGKDPVYLDSPSILMPAPPPDLTAASGAFVMDGASSRRALTTAMLDLASRGLISFREEKGLLGLSTRVGVDTAPGPGDPVEEAQRARNARRPSGPAEDVALRRLRGIDGSKHYIEPDDLPKFGTAVPAFDAALEQHVVARGWMVERPSKVIGRWVGRGVIAVVAGVAALIVGFNVPISGLVMIGGAAVAGGIVIMLFARGMPTVTMPGAMIRAMLHAYRRTLHKTMEQARSMQEVVETAGLDWLETPDQAVVWATALGLQDDIEAVLKRSLEDVQAGRAAVATTWFPAWYTNTSESSFAGAVAAGSGASIFSGSAVPDLGSMMSALGTIGNAPSSSGSGGGGGFSGGSSGGGGGGAGGGF